MRPVKDTPQAWPNHGYTPGRFTRRCQVMLARYRCPFDKDRHNPDLPPEDIDAFGYIRNNQEQQP